MLCKVQIIRNEVAFIGGQVGGFLRTIVKHLTNYKTPDAHRLFTMKSSLRNVKLHDLSPLTSKGSPTIQFCVYFEQLFISDRSKRQFLITKRTRCHLSAMIPAYKTSPTNYPLKIMELSW